MVETLQPGQMLSQYRLVELTGEGGMGVVWRAVDTRLDRDVALKILAPHVASNPDLLERFRREAKAIASLNHPNIVTIHAVEEVDGVPFIAMELLEGKPLSASIAGGGIPIHDFFSLAIPLADALGSAHERGIIHRDLKPANVMVGPEGRPKILDFGLAKLVQDPPRQVDDEESTGTSKEPATRALTREGKILGTMPYMSPEQARGDATDARSDIFSLGIIFYELATGRRPFSGATAADLISSILRDEPVPVTDHGPRLPRRLDEILSTCLHKEPDLRYQSAVELRDELRELQTEVSTGSAQLGPAHRPTMRLTALLTAGGVAVALTIGAVAMYRYSAAGAPPPPPSVRSIAADSIAVMPFKNMSAEENEYFADGMTEELTNALARVSGLHVPGRTSVYALRDQGLTILDIGQRLGVGAVLEGSVRIAGNRLRVTAQLVDASDGFQIWSETYDRQMKDIFEIQDEISRAIVERLRVQLAERSGPLVQRSTESLEAYNLYLQGRHHWNRRTTAGLERAVEMFGKAAEIDPQFALAYAGLADAYVLMPERSDVDEDVIFPRAKEAALRALEIDDTLAEAHTSLGQVMRLYDRNFEAAEAELRRAIELDPDYATAHHWLGMNLFFDQDRREEGLKEIERAERLDPVSGVIKFSLGGVLRAQGFLEDATDKYEELRELDPTFPVHGQLSATYFERRMWLESVEALRQKRSLDVFTMQDWVSLTGTLHLAGEHRAELEEARLSRKEFPESWQTLELEARALIALDRLDDLWRLLEEGSRLLTSLAAGPNMIGLAAELRVHGYPDAAREVARRAVEIYEALEELGLPAGTGYRLAVATALIQMEEIGPARSLFDRAAEDDRYGARMLPEAEAFGYSGSLAALAGDRKAAAKYAMKLESMDASQTDGANLFWRAAIASCLGDRKRSVELLHNAFDKGFWTYGRVHRNPLFQGLWGDPAYRELLESMGLPLPRLRERTGGTLRS